MSEHVHNQRERLVFGCVRVIKKQRRRSLCLSLCVCVCVCVCVCERWRALGVTPGTINMPPPPTKPSFVTTPSLDTTAIRSLSVLLTLVWKHLLEPMQASLSHSLLSAAVYEHLADLNRSCVTQTSLECYLGIDYGWDKCPMLGWRWKHCCLCEHRFYAQKNQWSECWGGRKSIQRIIIS